MSTFTSNLYFRDEDEKNVFFICKTNYIQVYTTASLAQSFKAPSPIAPVGSSNLHQNVVFEHMQTGERLLTA